MMKTLFKTPEKKITCLHSDDWVRVVSLVSMIQSGAFILGGGCVITGKLFGYDFLSTGNSILYVLIAMTVGVFGLFLGMYLYDGVDEKNPNKLLAWIFYAGFVQLLLILDLGKYLLYYPAEENWENILGIVLCLIIYSLFILLINIHRQVLLLLMADNQQPTNRKRKRKEPSSYGEGEIEMQSLSVAVSVVVSVPGPDPIPGPSSSSSSSSSSANSSVHSNLELSESSA